MTETCKSWRRSGGWIFTRAQKRIFAIDTGKVTCKGFSNSNSHAFGKLSHRQMKAIVKRLWSKHRGVERGIMTDLNTLYALVKGILEDDEKARGNDMWLYLQVCKVKNLDAVAQPFYIVMQKTKDLGLPNFESVSRARRKVQMEHEELKPSKEIQDIRDDYEQMYFEWALRGNG